VPWTKSNDNQNEIFGLSTNLGLSVKTVNIWSMIWTKTFISKHELDSHEIHIFCEPHEM